MDCLVERVESVGSVPARSGLAPTDKTRLAFMAIHPASRPGPYNHPCESPRLPLVIVVTARGGLPGAARCDWLAGSGRALTSTILSRGEGGSGGESPPATQPCMTRLYSAGAAAEAGGASSRCEAE